MTAAAAATVADLVTFLAMLAYLGPTAEANPLVQSAIAAGLLAAVIVAKVGVLVVLMAWRRAVRRYQRTVYAVGYLVGLAGAWSNVRAVAA